MRFTLDSASTCALASGPPLHATQDMTDSRHSDASGCLHLQVHAAGAKVLGSKHSQLFKVLQLHPVQVLCHTQQMRAQWRQSYMKHMLSSEYLRSLKGDVG